MQLQPRTEARDIGALRDGDQVYEPLAPELAAMRRARAQADEPLWSVITGSGRVRADATMFRNWMLAAGILELAAGSTLPTISGYAQESETALTCTNPASGASWQIMIDYRQPAVDSNPAEISRAGISWFDPKDGSNNVLDRRSGELTARVASSTGGYFRRARCALEKPR